MKKITIISLISALACSPVVHSGAMGEAESPLCLSTFFALEGGYTDNSIKGYEITFAPADLVFIPFKSNSGYSGRVSVGIANKIDELGLSGEIGWGYYGQTKFNTNNPADILLLSNQYTLSGFDVLAGIAYVQSNFSVFFKAGAMIENMSTKFHSNFNTMSGRLEDSYSLEDNRTEVLPELKIGGAYNLNENWAITAAYFYAFGSNVKTTALIEPLNLVTSVEDINLRNSSLSTVLVGLQFSI